MKTYFLSTPNDADFHLDSLRETSQQEESDDDDSESLELDDQLNQLREEY